jgi:hypothetical protein
MFVVVVSVGLRHFGFVAVVVTVSTHGSGISRFSRSGSSETAGGPGVTIAPSGRQLDPFAPRALR